MEPNEVRVALAQIRTDQAEFRAEVLPLLESMRRTLQGAAEEGATGIVLRTGALEDRTSSLSREMIELRSEWRSFRRVVMVWALVALAGGATAGTMLSNLIPL